MRNNHSIDLLQYLTLILTTACLRYSTLYQFMRWRFFYCFMDVEQFATAQKPCTMSRRFFYVCLLSSSDVIGCNARQHRNLVPGTKHIMLYKYNFANRITAAHLLLTA